MGAMMICEPSELARFADALQDAGQGSGRLIGLDPGTKTIGLAICDDGWAIAAPVRTIKREKFMADATALLAYASGEAVSGIVIGLPVNMDGSEGPRAQSCRAFARNLEKLTALPLLLWNEALSTQRAAEAFAPRKLDQAKRDGRLDAAAAAVILQGACDAMRALPPR